jgi:hypothetical protein
MHGTPNRRLEPRHAGGDFVEPLDHCGRLARHLGPHRTYRADKRSHDPEAKMHRAVAHPS